MTLQFTRSFQFTTVLSLLTLAIAPTAFAGEAFVNNTQRYTTGYSETDLNIETSSFTDGSREFASYAEKIFIDGEIEIDSPQQDPRALLVERGSSSPTVAFDKFAIHTSSSEEVGQETFGSDTFVDGTIFTREDFVEDSHTTSAGVR